MDIQAAHERALADRDAIVAERVNHPIHTQESWEEHATQMRAEYTDICVRAERAIGLESGLKELLQQEADSTGDTAGGTNDEKAPIPMSRAK